MQRLSILLDIEYAQSRVREALEHSAFTGTFPTACILERLPTHPYLLEYTHDWFQKQPQKRINGIKSALRRSYRERHLTCSAYCTLMTVADNGRPFHLCCHQGCSNRRQKKNKTRSRSRSRIDGLCGTHTRWMQARLDILTEVMQSDLARMCIWLV
jgi:hypothetical protein